MGLITKRFNCTKNVQTLEIPSYVTEIYIEMYGAGGSGKESSHGAKVTGTYRFKDSDSKTLNIYVGGSDGHNGGDSDIRVNGTTLYDRIAVAGGGSSYIDLLKYGTAKVSDNTADGYVIVSYRDYTYSYYLEKDEKKYLIANKYFDKESKTFKEVTFDEIYNNSITEEISFRDINKPFTIDDTIYTPSDYINFTEYKIKIMTPQLQKEWGNIRVDFSELSDKALEKTVIKLIETNVNNIKVYSNNKIYTKLNYSILNDNSKKWILQNEVHNELSCEYNLNLKFINTFDTINKLEFFTKKPAKYILINERDLNITTDRLKIYIKPKNNYDKILVNPLYGENYNYGIQTLQKV